MTHTTVPLPATQLAEYSDDDPQLDLLQISETRLPDGTRRFGSHATIRRLVIEGVLPHELAPNSRRYLVRLSSLETLERSRGTGPEAELAELELAANRVLNSLGPLSDEQVERIADRLKGVR